MSGGRQGRPDDGRFAGLETHIDRLRIAASVSDGGCYGFSL